MVLFFVCFDVFIEGKGKSRIFGEGSKPCRRALRPTLAWGSRSDTHLKGFLLPLIYNRADIFNQYIGMDWAAPVTMLLKIEKSPTPLLKLKVG